MSLLLSLHWMKTKECSNHPQRGHGHLKIFNTNIIFQVPHQSQGRLSSSNVIKMTPTRFAVTRVDNIPSAFHLLPIPTNREDYTGNYQLGREVCI